MVPVPQPGPLAMVFFDVGDTLTEMAVDGTDVALAALRTSDLGREAAPDDQTAAVTAMDTVYRRGLNACHDAAEEAAFMQGVADAGLSVLARRACRPAPGPEEVAIAGRALADYDRWYRVRPGMDALVRRTAAAGLRVGVISNWPPSLHRLLRHLGLGPFEVVACSGVLGVTKPDAAIFHWALERAGIAAHRAIMVGNDVERDVEAALAVGMHALWMAPGMDAGDVARQLGLA